jgi:hypothetical protein
MFNVSQAKINQLRIPLPPLDRQRDINGLVTAASRVAERAVAAANQARATGAALLDDLLSGRHEIPASYDELLDLAS